MSGQSLIERRARNLCVTCGYRTPPFDVETGAPLLECAICLDKAKAAEQDARKKARQAAREDAQKQAMFDECL